MKISIGMNLQPGPWGGGNQFGHALSQYLRDRGVKVSFDLKDPDLDLVLLADPRKETRISAYTDKEIYKYLLLRNWKAIVVHRINECDERKGTQGVNDFYHRANLCADHTVFVSSWIRDLHLKSGIGSQSYSVLLAGADSAVFNSDGYTRWNKTEKLKLVTHHWSTEFQKGFDIYTHLDAMLSRPEWKDKIEFTYIGKLPNFQWQHTRHVPPQSGIELARSIKENHVYLTGSQNEPSGMHHIEGAMCGLPLLYRQSGGIPEYCQGFGIAFNGPEDFDKSLAQMLETYDTWAERMNEYPYTAERMCQTFYNLALELINNREPFLKKRSHRDYLTRYLKRLWL